MKPKLLVLTAPVILIGVLQASGCLRRTPPPPPPGGTYLSQSAGASFDQTVLLKGEGVDEGDHIARFDLQGTHRPLHKPGTVYVAAGEQGLLVSQNEGETWQLIPTPLSSTLDVALLTNGTLVVTGTGPEGQGFLLRSPDDGLSWQTVLTVPIPVDEGPIKFVGGREAVPAVVLTIEPDPFDANRLYAASNLGGVLVGENSAKVWRTIHTLVPSRFNPSASQTRAGVKKLIPSPNKRGEVLVITLENKLWRVVEGTQTEIPIPVEQTEREKQFFVSKGNHAVLDVAFAKTNRNLLFAGVDNGVVLSANGGTSWRTLSLPIESVIDFNTIRVAISPTNATRFLVGVNGVVYRSEDGGHTWNTFSLGLTAHAIIDILINPTNAAKVLVVTRPIET